MPLRSEFTLLPADLEAFLFARVWDDGAGSQLSVLSAIARLDIDPWAEAARLAALPREKAAAGLAAILGRLPGRNPGAPDIATTADRLVMLLPEHGPGASVRGGNVPARHGGIAGAWLLLILLASSLALAIGNWWS
jgi:hypothetical protein